MRNFLLIGMLILLVIILILLLMSATIPAMALSVQPDVEPLCVEKYSNTYCSFLPVVTCTTKHCYPPDSGIHE